MRTKSPAGWGQLPRSIARAFAGAKINGSESRVLWAMVYKTIAFNKSNDGIPWSQLAELTGIDQWNLSRPINSLLKKGVIFTKEGRYGIQTDFSKWKIPSNQMVIKDSPSVSKDSPSVSKDSPSNQMDSRDPSKRTIKRKGLSTSLREEQIEKNKRGIHRFVESIGNMPGRKKRKSLLTKKSQNQEK